MGLTKKHVANNMAPELRFFLVKNGAYRKFINNCITQSALFNSYDRIIACILFCETPEGLKYWWDLNEKFEKHML